MYNINPNNSFANTYKVGAGEAQVFDFGTAEKAIQTGINLGERRRAAEQKKAKLAKSKADELIGRQPGAVHPSDIEDVNKDLAEYRKQVKDAYLRGGGNLSLEDQTALEQRWGQINQFALNSAKRAEADRANLKSFEDPTKPIRDKVKIKGYEAYAQPSRRPDGTYDFTGIKDVTQKYPIADARKKFFEGTMKAVQENEVYGATDFSIDKAANLARNFIEQDDFAKRELADTLAELEPQEFNDLINRVYNSKVDDFGNKNTVYKGNVDVKGLTPENITGEQAKDLAAYLWAGEAYRYGRKFAPSAYAPGGQIDKSTPVVTNVIMDGKGEYVIDKSNIPSDKVLQNLVLKKTDDKGKAYEENVTGTLDRVTYDVDEKGKKVITGGVLIEQLSPQEASEIKKRNDEKRKALLDEVEIYDDLYRRKRAGETLGDASAVEFTTMQKKYGGRPSEKNKEFKPEPLERRHKLTPTQAKEISFNKYGVKLDADLPSQAKVQTVKEKPATGYSNQTTLKDKSGKAFKAGVKNGKWYNIETGAEIK